MLLRVGFHLDDLFPLLLDRQNLCFAIFLLLHYPLKYYIIQYKSQDRGMLTVHKAKNDRFLPQYLVRVAGGICLRSPLLEKKIT